MFDVVVHQVPVVPTRATHEERDLQLQLLPETGGEHQTDEGHPVHGQSRGQQGTVFSPVYL